MKNEEEIRRVLLNILGIGLLRTRAWGCDGRPEDCAVEADHLHNLPRLVSDLKIKPLVYYWNIERPAFIHNAKQTLGFEADWKRLGELVAEAQKAETRWKFLPWVRQAH